MNEPDAAALWAQVVEASAGDLGAFDALSDAQLSEILLALDIDERRKALACFDRAKLGRFLPRLPHRTLIALGKQGVAALGTYRVQLKKQERIRGKMIKEQTLDVTIRQDPAAFRIEYVRGPSAGRKVLYDVELRSNELRVKEPGIKGLAGALWLNLDNVLTRGDTNHRATEIGLRALLDLIDADTKKAEAAGGYTRKDEGFDESGLYCALFDSPKGVSGLYAVSTRIGFNVGMCLPMRVEVYDTQGLLETYRYSDVERTNVGTEFFTLKGAGL